VSISEETIEIAGYTIDAVRKDIKHMHLTVYPPEGKIRLSAPISTDREVVRRFAISKLGWIKKQIRKFKEQPRETERSYVPGESHYFQGKRYLLDVKGTSGKHKILTSNKRLEMHVHSTTTRDNREVLMKEWYRDELKSLIPDIVEKWEPILGVKVKFWGVKQMRTMWGTCNPDSARIWLNLELAKKPIHCLEYIVVHEMVHLLERHHNERFRELMDINMPKWRVYREELNKLPVAHSDWRY
jgi:predicted metal-dependent hydrolase